MNTTIEKEINSAYKIYSEEDFAALSEKLDFIITNFSESLDTNLTLKASYYQLKLYCYNNSYLFNIAILEDCIYQLELINSIDVSHYQLICSNYNYCIASYYQKALLIYPSNDVLLYYYALKLKQEENYLEAINLLNYLLECHPDVPEAHLLLWDLKTLFLESNGKAVAEPNYYTLLDFATETNNFAVLEKLQEHNSLDASIKNHINIQKSLWVNEPAVIIALWEKDWQYWELAYKTRYLLCDYANAFKYYFIISNVLEAPIINELPAKTYTNFKVYKEYMKQVTVAGQQQTVHLYLLLAKAFYYHQKDEEMATVYVNNALQLAPAHPCLLQFKATLMAAVDEYSIAINCLDNAAKNGLSTAEYLLDLIEIYEKQKNREAVLETIQIFHNDLLPVPKTYLYQGVALAMLGYSNDAVESLTKGIDTFGYTPYLMRMYHWRMLLYKKLQKYTLFFDDVKSKLQYLRDTDDEYWFTFNICVETIFEQGNNKRCYEYASTCYRRGRLLPNLVPVLKWLCDLGYNLEDPLELYINPISIDDIIAEPTTYEDYRNNALVYWALDENEASAKAFEQAAVYPVNKEFYYKRAFWRAARMEDKNYMLYLYEKLMEISPKKREWLIDYRYAFTLFETKRYEAAKTAYNNLITLYPERAFKEFPKDINHNAAVLKICSESLGNITDYVKYNSMLMSWQAPRTEDCKEHQVLADNYFKDDILLRYNLLELSKRIDAEMTEREETELHSLQQQLKARYFV